MGSFGTFNVIVGKVSFTFNIVGYDYTKIRNVKQDIDAIISTMKSRGDFKYEHGSDCAEMLVEEAWKHHIHLDYDYPEYGTYRLTE